MKNKILYVNACTRPCSRTHELAKHLLDSLCGEITQLDLYKSDLVPLDNNELEKRTENIKANNLSCPEFEYARQFACADTIVVAAPFWDLSFPSILKLYIENITVSGITFEYSQEGRPISKCKSKKLYYVTTSGGYIGNNNFGFDYIKAIAQNFFGIKEVQFFSAEGLDIFGADVTEIMNKAKACITNAVV